MKKITVILVLVVAMVGLFASCEKECTCEHSYVLGKHSILGKWNVVSKTFTGTPYSWLESLEFQEGGIVKAVYGSFYYGTASTTSSYGTFAINDSILIAAGPVYKIASLDANELNLIGTAVNVDQENGAEMEIRYQLKKE